MDRESLENIIKVSYENEMVIMADEVYQQNVYAENKKFISVRQVMHEMGEPYSSSVELCGAAYGLQFQGAKLRATMLMMP